jgi:hypothetical protein
LAIRKSSTDTDTKELVIENLEQTIEIEKYGLQNGSSNNVVAYENKKYSR